MLCNPDVSVFIRIQTKKAGFLNQEILPFPYLWGIIDAYRTFFTDVSDDIEDTIAAIQGFMVA